MQFRRSFTIHHSPRDDYALYKANQGSACKWRFRNAQSDPLRLPIQIKRDAQCLKQIEDRIAAKDVGPLWHIPVEDFTFNRFHLTRKQKAMAAVNEKYFFEDGPWGHFDKRYYREPLGRRYSELPQVKGLQRKLFQAWHNFSFHHSIPYFINHGSLLSWVWNSRSFPWDMDIDVKTSIKGMTQLEALNQTLWLDRYILDVNYHWWIRTKQTRNLIDARFIDTLSGCFIDITGLNKRSEDGLLSCKANHAYRWEDVIPLHLTDFMGSRAWRPNKPIILLSSEYGWLGMVRSWFFNFYFNQTSRDWEQDQNFPLLTAS